MKDIMDTNTTQVIQQFGNKIDSYVQILASKANDTTAHFWPLFIKQQEIIGYTHLIAFILAFLMALAGIFIGFKLKKKRICDEVGTIIMCLSFVLTVGTFIAFCATASDIISQIYNPEYAAIQQVVSMIK